MPSFPESELNVVPIVGCISFELQSSKLALLSIYLFSLVWMHLEMHQPPPPISYSSFCTTLLCCIIKIIISTENQEIKKITEFCHEATRKTYQTEGKTFVLLLYSENYHFKLVLL